MRRLVAVADRRTFGLGLPNAFPVGEPNLDFLRVAERAEQLGYDMLWAGDHVVFHIPRLEVFTTLAANAKSIQLDPSRALSYVSRAVFTLSIGQPETALPMLEKIPVSS